MSFTPGFSRKVGLSMPTIAAIFITGLAAFGLPGCAGAARPIARPDDTTQSPNPPACPSDSEFDLKATYTKREFRVPMRDGAHLFTQVYAPRDRTRTYPILMIRTPYSCSPYGEDKYATVLGPHADYDREGFIIVKQDVRGCFMSEGEFVNMRPHIDTKSGDADIDESSDTYDTIDWLIKNIPNNNGRVGMWGISYPGFYAAAGMIDAHPALKAVSPQAPIADWFFDDFHHHGAFFLPHSFNFMASFGRKREGLVSQWGERFDHKTPDGYQFFMDMGPLKNANTKYLHGKIEIWNDMVAHPNYDDYWQPRNLLPHLHHVAPAVMTVGGWFDAEDLYGALKIYRAVEHNDPEAFNMLVMGPWPHGGWGRTPGDQLGNVSFGAKTSDFYRVNMELPFFRHYLKGEGSPKLPEAFVFETGANEWRRFDDWPPAETQIKQLYLRKDGRLSWRPPEQAAPAFDEYVSDPAKPVPSTEEIEIGMPRPYMTDDQRFAARRPDVLAYASAPLDSDVTLAGPLLADLWVSTSGGDSDWIVKLIDVYPADAVDTPVDNRTRPMGGYQMMVRSEVLRGRFRNSYEHPEPFEPDAPTNIKLELLDVLHTFKAGHRIMVQVQSTWFPIVDRNPQKYVENIFKANEDDFVKATQRVYRCAEMPSSLRVGVLELTEPENSEVDLESEGKSASSEGLVP